MPRGFWRGFVRTELLSTDLPKQLRMMYRRSFDFFMNKKRKGAIGEFGNLTAKQKKVLGGCHNQVKCTDLGLMLFEFFIDSMKSLRCRPDSLLLMQKARSLRHEMILNGVPDADIP